MGTLLSKNPLLKVTHEIKVNLIKEDLLRARKYRTEVKTVQVNMKSLFILTTDKSLFNGIEFIEKMKACIYYENVFFREIA